MTTKRLTTGAKVAVIGLMLCFVAVSGLLAWVVINGI